MTPRVLFADGRMEPVRLALRTSGRAPLGAWVFAELPGVSSGPRADVAEAMASLVAAWNRMRRDDEPRAVAWRGEPS